MDFGGPDRPKLSPRLSETLILIKSPFSPWIRFVMKSQAHEVPKGHQGPGHEVPAGVGRCVDRCPGERLGVSGVASGGPRWRVPGQLSFRLPLYILFGATLGSFWDPLGVPSLENGALA